jgi:putative protease
VQILCPLRASSEIEPLVRVGARYFYAGVDSTVLFGSQASASPCLNCRPWPGSNFESDESLRAAIELAKGNTAHIYLTFNWYAYRSWEIAAILDFLSRHDGLAGVVVVDLTLLDRIRQSHPELQIILGSVAHVTNSAAVEFFVSRGVSRIVLPRHLTIGEISDLITNHPDVDFEVFIKNQDCFFAQGRCYHTHSVINSEVPYRCDLARPETSIRPLSTAELDALNTHYANFFSSCGVCAIQELHQIGVSTVKLVGRDLPIEDRRRDFLFIQRAIDALERDSEPKAELVQEYHREIYGMSCRRDCMY